jgi:hypothetical protein
MVALVPPQTILTPAGAANTLQSKGLDALGLTVPNLSPIWSPNAPGAYDQNTMTLQLTGLSAPFRAIREFVDAPVLFSGPDGKPLPGPAATLRLHPEAARRLVRLVEARLGASPAVYPVPVAAVVRGMAVPAPVPVPEWYFAGATVFAADAITLTFHDARGLIVDPAYAASLFADLLSAHGALYVGNGPVHAVGDAGGLTAIAGLAAGILAHVIDPHGWGYVPTRDIARVKITDGSNAQAAAVPDGGIVSLAAGQGLGRSAADDAADGANRPLRWGFATAGTLARTRLTPPALPAGVSLPRQFLRVMAVDLEWHLRGNRGSAALAGIPGDDGATPAFLLPQLRDPVPNFAYLPDAQEVVGAAAAMTAGFGPQASIFAIAISPILDDALASPPQPGSAGHWPLFPPAAAPQPITAATNPREGFTTKRRASADGAGADRDVVVTIPARKLPDFAHVRVFPRRFQEIAAIGNTPSFVRPDGGAAIARPATDIKILLTNPFNLAPAEPFPNPANLTVDFVVTDRNGRRKLFSQTTVAVDAATEHWVDNSGDFGGATLLGTPGLKAVLDGLGMRGVAAAPLFGVPRTTPLPAPGGSVIAFARALASETQPRQGPRLPTQMRFESMLVSGTGGAADTPLAWSAVLTGARFTLEARSFRPDLGNPGNQAGPDIHATGVRGDGFLARDLALHAIKRAQPIVPLGGTSHGWVIDAGGNNWNPPAPDSTGTVAAVALETVAAICDTPELSVLPDPQPGDSVQGLVDAITNALGAPHVPVNVANANEIVLRVQREIVASKHGLRDALWSLRRALGQARELIYIESPAFARTARPAGPPDAHEIDLVDIIRQQLVANPRLKVIVCTPRVPDFDPSRGGWVRTAFAHRKEAITLLSSAAQARVAAFHPIGFPGRSSPLRTTTIIVDDVWCLVGTSHFRRRGMTFDGAADVASIDRQIAHGYAAAIANFRQRLMAQRLGVNVPTVPDQATAIWVRLAQPETAFSVVAELLNEAGEGRLTPIWAGPDDTSVLPQTDDVADPDGANGASFITFIAAAVAGE